MAQLLIELFSEEIPARMQLQAAKDFERLMGAKLLAAGLSYSGICSYVGPRRLVLVIEELPAETAAVSEEVKGPREGAPPQALDGFLRKVGLTQDALTIENGVYMARIEKPGVKTADVLGAMLREVILSFPWPKSMRSGTSSFRWVRPLKRILFLFNGSTVPFDTSEFSVPSDLIFTEGHRFLGSGQKIPVASFEQYKEVLRENFVILDHSERQTIIWEKGKQLCAEQGLELIEDQGLLEEVAGLNEWPVPLLGDMNIGFLSLPPEVIKTSMRTHQKYFAVRRPDGKMAPKFLIVANMKANDSGIEIKRGNAKVLSARLSDGVFFWQEDNRQGNFDAWLEKLKGTTFHVKLGTMAQRVERITALAGFVAGEIGANVELTKKAARLAKADLASHMVMEFPELQGIMGGYYADAARLEPEVADAIREHYKPQGPGDSLPTTKVSAAVALADKIDTLAGFFAIGEKPTGSKDPQALRRSALGVLRILRQTGARNSLKDVIANAVREQIEGVIKEASLNRLIDSVISFQSSRLVHIGKLSDTVRKAKEQPEFHAVRTLVAECVLVDQNRDELPDIYASIVMFVFPNIVDAERDLLDFFTDRLRVMLRDEGAAFDILEAVLAVKDNDIVRVVTRLRALQDIFDPSLRFAAGIDSRYADDVLAVHKRAANILAAAKWTNQASDLLTPNDAPEVESALIKQLSDAKSTVAEALRIENYRGALLSIAALRQNVDAFLDGVLVNDSDEAVRSRRLNILANICALSESVADLSKLA